MSNMSSDSDLEDYYARRANEYERIYDKLERQADLARLHEIVPSLLEGRHVLEIACGTGYWTQFVARRAASMLATDVNEPVLELARRKHYPDGHVSFERLDIYSDDDSARRFDAGLAAFWWSHVPRQGQAEFIERLHSRLEPGALVVLLDNRYVEGSSSPLTRSDEHGNTYQMRSLDDGTTHEVLKNIPDAAELANAFAGYARDLDFVELEYFWYATYRVNKRS